DYGPVHVDERQSKARGLDGTIAHGLLTLSLCSNVGAMVKTALPTISDRRLLLNYGYDKIRFIAPVPSGRRVRAQYRLMGVDLRHAAVPGLRTSLHIHQNGHHLDLGRPISERPNFFRTSDGRRMYLLRASAYHPNLIALLSLLKCANTTDAISEAVSHWSSA